MAYGQAVTPTQTPMDKPQSGTASQPQRQVNVSGVTTDQLIKSTNDAATAAIAAAHTHALAAQALAKESREYYEGLSKLVAGASAAVLLLLGFIGYNDRKQRGDIDREVREQLKQAEEGKRSVEDLKKKLEEHISMAQATVATINDAMVTMRQQELRANLWILDINRAMNSLVVSICMRDDQPNREHYVKVAREILEKIAADESMASDIRAYGYRHLAGVYKRLHRRRDAWMAIQKALDLTPTNRDAALLYNAACMAAINGLWEITLDFLAQSFQVDPEMKDVAREDPDFEKLRHDARFRGLVAGPEDSPNAT